MPVLQTRYNGCMEPEQPKKPPFAFARQMAIALELPFTLAGPILLGGLGGALADRWLGTAPFLMLGLGMAGLFAGVREVSRRMKRLEGNAGGKPKP